MFSIQNKALQQENSSLKQRTTSLTEEKNRLEKRLATSIQTDLQEALVKGGNLGGSAIGSAAPNLVSLQQKQISKALLYRVWMQLSLTFWLSSLKKDSPLNSQPTFSPPDHLDWLHDSHMTLTSPSNNSQYLLREEPWWGASESEWNPPRN